MQNVVKAFAFVTLASSVLAIGCAAPTATQPEEDGETGSFLLAGNVLSAAQVAGYVRAAGFPENVVGKMVCTAKYESSFYEKASNGSHYGLFQISKQHLGATSGCPSTVSAVYQAANNAKCAFGVYKAQGLGAWEAYKSHKSECDRYKAPASAASAADAEEPADDASSDANDSSSSSSSSMVGGGCFSSTLQSMTDELACVQSGLASSHGVWFQCHAGKWYRGGDATSGPYGACGSSNALE